ncbi:hypothetical protein WJX72_005435 [[Myrmecia] bisecta]|uniref:Peroxin-19 n=1 Tax=[Myrmecia] bisecta TaxID=41462 RepID=A0AAW1PSE1_9CHLO
MGPEHDHDLDDLLNDALDDFANQEGRGVSKGSTAAPSAAPAPVFDPLARTSSKTKPAAAAQRNPLQPAPTNSASSSSRPQQGGLAFDPLELAAVDRQGAGGSHGPPGGHDLEATLRALAEHSRSAGSSSGAGHAEQPDFLDEGMLSRLTEAMGSMGGGNSEPDGAFASMADSIMHQLLSKDVLYQPMQDIGARYPVWLAANRDKLSEEELQQYMQQHEYIQKICAAYETEPDNFALLFSLIQKMQACGQPPQEIVDELAPGLQFDADGLPKFPNEEGAGALPDMPGCSLQ